MSARYGLWRMRISLSAVAAMSPAPTSRAATPARSSACCSPASSCASGTASLLGALRAMFQVAKVPLPPVVVTSTVMAPVPLL